MRKPPTERLLRLLERPRPAAVWIGARRAVAVQNADVCIWFDSTHHEVRVAAYIDSASPREALAILLGEAMLTPRQGVPAVPTAIMVLTPRDEPPVRAMAQMLGIELPAPSHLDFDIERMLDGLEQVLSEPEPVYLQDPSLGVERMARLYAAVRDFWFLQPWKYVGRGRIITIEHLAPRPLYASVRGRDGEPPGLWLSYIPRAFTLPTRPGPAPMLTLALHAAREAGPALVAEAARHHWPVAAAYPVLTVPGDRNRLPRAAEVELTADALEALTHALTLPLELPRIASLRGGGQVLVNWTRARRPR